MTSRLSHPGLQLAEHEGGAARARSEATRSDLRTDTLHLGVYSVRRTQEEKAEYMFPKNYDQ